MLLSYLSILLLLFSTSQTKDEAGQSKLLGFRISKYSSYFPFSCSEDMLIPEVSEGTEVTIRIVGHLANVTEVGLTASAQNCEPVYPDTIATMDKDSDEVGTITLTTPTNLPEKKTTMYYCFRAGKEDKWIHQGLTYWAKLIIVQRYTVAHAVIIGCILSLFFATAMNSSLLRLSSLNVDALRTKADSGTIKEKMVCRALISLRKRGHLIALAFVPGIVFFKTTLTVLLKSIFNGWLAVIVSVMLIVLIVEVVPRIRRREISKDSVEMQAGSTVFNESYAE